MRDKEFLATSTPKKELNVEDSKENINRNGTVAPKSKIPHPSPINLSEAAKLKPHIDNIISPTKIPKLNVHGKNYFSELKDASGTPEKISTLSDRQQNSNISPVALTSKDISSNRITKNLDANSKNGPERKKISVAVRIRPLNTRETADNGFKNIIRIKTNALYVDGGTRKKSNIYKFDVDYILQSFDENHPDYCTQEKMYQCIGSPLLEAAFKGYNACLLAYGQTGSGKSFSMMGRTAIDIDSSNYSGIIPRFCRDLFTTINNLPDNSSADLKISYFEIYNEKIYDLLLTEGISKRNTLKVRESPTLGAYVENLSIKHVKNYDELRLWLIQGNKNRAIAATSLNEQSSRSHSIFKVELDFSMGSQDGDQEGKSIKSSVSLVDLAGSERLLSGKVTNTNFETASRSEEKHRESVSINKSLLTLAHVISSLADKKPHVPYRDSVLTRLLKENIGGNSLTTMLTTVSPSILCLEETLATLRFACKAKQIVNTAEINENPQEKIIRELKSQISELKLLQFKYEAVIFSKKHLQHDSEIKELEKLQTELDETEKELVEADNSCKTKFEVSQAAQFISSAQLEQLKEELESKNRILSNSNNKFVNLAPYKSNFLKELENVLQEDVDTNVTDKFGIVTEWCRNNNVNYYLNTKYDLVLTDYQNKKQAIVTIKDLNSFESIDNMTKDISWCPTTSRKQTRKDIIKSLNSLYTSLTCILPPEENENLDVLYTTISKSLQKYEDLLLNIINENN